MHGGKALKGAAHPRFKNGRYSKYLPAGMNERYQEALQDADLTSLHDEIALLDARLGELLTQVRGSGSAGLWRQVYDLQRALQEALQQADAEGIARAASQLREIAGLGLGQESRWQEVYDLIERRRRLVESERRRQVELAQVLTLAQVFTLLGAVSGLIRDHVRDEGEIRAIVSGIAELAASHGAGIAVAGRLAPAQLR